MSKVRVQVAYAPILPAYLDSAPSLKPPRPPPALPFFKDKAHTVPTRWGLYRPLLRATNVPHVNTGLAVPSSSSELSSNNAVAGPSTPPSYPFTRRWIKQEWSRQRGDTSMEHARQFLTYHYNLLDRFRTGHVSRMETRLEKEFRRMDERQEQVRLKAEQAKLDDPRPRLTGGYIYPSYFNPPLPRMVPQPPNISGMMRRRIRARENRLDRSRALDEQLKDMDVEDSFRSSLLGKPDEAWRTNGPGGFRSVVNDLQKEMNRSFRREEARSQMIFDEETVLKVEATRKARARTKQKYGEERNKAKREAKALALAEAETNAHKVRGDRAEDKW